LVLRGLHRPAQLIAFEGVLPLLVLLAYKGLDVSSNRLLFGLLELRQVLNVALSQLPLRNLGVLEACLDDGLDW
jgi:hypothetical protein